MATTVVFAGDAVEVAARIRELLADTGEQVHVYRNDWAEPCIVISSIQDDQFYADYLLHGHRIVVEDDGSWQFRAPGQ